MLIYCDEIQSLWEVTADYDEKEPINVSAAWEKLNARIDINEPRA